MHHKIANAIFLKLIENNLEKRMRQKKINVKKTICIVFLINIIEEHLDVCLEMY